MVMQHPYSVQWFIAYAIDRTNRTTLPLQKKTKGHQTAFVLNAPGLPDEAQIEAIDTTFRLFNPYLKCALYACQEKLPDW